MKPIEQQNESHIARISLSNFTGSISLINSEHLMLSSSTDHPLLHQHIHWLTQPTLGVRSRAKKNPSPTFTRVEKRNHPPHPYDSSDSGVDLSLSTNSSHPSYPSIHRPLSALNEDAIYPDQRTTKKIVAQLPSVHPERKASKKQTPLHSNGRLPRPDQRKDTTSSSSTDSTPRVKPKAITPLDHYPNPEQIRAHINRSVIERQHPSTSNRKVFLQQIVPFDATPSKVNNRLPRQQLPVRHLSNLYQPDSHALTMTLKPIKQTSARSHHHESKNKQLKSEKSKVKDKQKTSLDQVDPLDDDDEDHQQHLKQFFSSTPRRHARLNLTGDDRSQPWIDDHERGKKKKTLRESLQTRREHRANTFAHPDILPYSAIRLNVLQPIPASKTKTKNPMENDVPPAIHRPALAPLRPTQMHFQLFETPLKVTQEPHRSPVGSNNSWLRTGQVPLIELPRKREEIPSQPLFRVKQNKKTHPFFATQSPSSWSVISEHQSQQQQIKIAKRSSPFSSSSSSPYSALTDGRYVVPSQNPPMPSFIDPPSQTSSRHTYPFTCAAEFDVPTELISAPDQREMTLEVAQLLGENPSHLQSGQLTTSVEQDDLSTNYDSDDGWSNDSAELLYSDEHYLKAKKKKHGVSSSSTRRVAQEQLDN